MQADRAHDAKRRQNQPWRAWYNTARWHKRRAHQLQAQPLCQRCIERDVLTPATVAHHIVKHDGDYQLFWFGELRSVCKTCHDTIEQGIEARGYEAGCDADGRPVAADHPWNRTT